jgi:enoyl-CoA hydratase
VSTVLVETHGAVTTVIINRPEVKNAVNPETALALVAAFEAFDQDESARVAVLCGAGGSFCAGADLHAVSTDIASWNLDEQSKHGPLGPSRLLLSKPVIAAVDGYAVAGGLELALWCDLRVAEITATFGVFCRRWGVPLIDGGTVRLPRLIGHSRALDMILTGRAVGAEEALAWGLANRVVAQGTARAEAEKLAAQLAAFPQRCLRADRLSSYQQWGMAQAAAITEEFIGGAAVMASGETVAGATQFHQGKGRHGQFD